MSAKLGMAVTTSYPLKGFALPVWGDRKTDASIGSDELNRDPPLTMWDYMRDYDWPMNLQKIHKQYPIPGHLPRYDDAEGEFSYQRGNTRLHLR